MSTENAPTTRPPQGGIPPKAGCPVQGLGRICALCACAALALPIGAVAQTTPSEGKVEVDVATRIKADVNGYTIEARVPWRLVGVTPADGLRIGFDVHVNDADEPGDVRDLKLVWAGTPGDDQHKSPRRFGTVALGAPQGDVTGVPFAEAAPTIDGETDPTWQSAAVLPLSHVRLAESAPGTSDLTATAYALYDADALYVLVDVLDDRIVVDTPGRPHLDDGVELYLDGGHERSAAYDENDLKLALRPGDDAASLTRLAVGGDYAGREPDAPWRRLAAARIEALRKAPLRVRVEDSEGQPVEGAEVHVAMRRHAFEFGTAVRAYLFAEEDPDGRRYRDEVERLYNTVVFENDFKWVAWDLAQSETHDRYRVSWLTEAVRWLDEKEIGLRGSPLLWPPLNRTSMRPDSVIALADHPDRLRQAWLGNIRTRLPALTALADVHDWDTINHITGWGQTTTNVLGADFNAEVMALARELAPDAEHWVNEGSVITTKSRVVPYERDVRDLIERGAAPDGIGFMGHFADGTFTPPDTVYALFDRFARLVPRLKITELDVQTLDDTLQAEYLRDVMTVAFSHPAVEGVVMWGFWEGAHWRPNAALYREDWTPKPAGEAWERLVLDEWWTDETLATDADGAARLRGFLGDYVVTARHGGREASADLRLRREGDTLVLTLGSAAPGRP